jgi:hypothetical protein
MSLLFHHFVACLFNPLQASSTNPMPNASQKIRMIFQLFIRGSANKFE